MRSPGPRPGPLLGGLPPAAPFVLRSGVLVSLLVGLLAGLPVLLEADSARAEEDDVRVVVTATGHRLVGRSAAAAAGPYVGLAVGGRVYELERRGSRIEQAGGTPVPDPAWVDFVRALVERLDHADAALADAARSALLALGDAARPYLEQARAEAGSPGRRQAIQAVLETLGPAPDEDTR